MSIDQRAIVEDPCSHTKTGYEPQRSKAELVLSEAEHAQLTAIARSRSLPAALTQRAPIVLACAGGDANSVASVSS